MNWTEPKTWVPAELTSGELNTHLRDNLKAIGDAWSAYTPTWTASTTDPTLGNGTLAGAYMRAGKLVHYRIELIFGSTTTVGSGTYSLTLPLAPHGDLTNGPVGQALGRLTGGSIEPGVCRYTTGTTFDIKASGATFTHNTPLVWASGSSIIVNGTYEAA